MSYNRIVLMGKIAFRSTFARFFQNRQGGQLTEYHKTTKAPLVKSGAFDNI
jgi:hypothetical protein